MANKKVTATQNDELFVLQSGLISESTKKIIEIRDFSTKIEDPENNHKEIDSPMFKLAGVDFSIEVLPDCEALMDRFIGVRLNNYGNEDQTTSMTVKASGVKRSWEMREVEAGRSRGIYTLLSHEKYRKWAKKHGDVLRLEVVVTVHRKAEGDGWTR